MFKKLISVMLAVLIVLGGMVVMADEGGIKVYVSVSFKGDVVNDKNAVAAVLSEVTLSGKEEYTVDDALAAFHELYYEGGASGYASSDGNWGRQVDVLWGDTSYNVGYMVNGGTEMAMDAAHVISDGAVIDAIVYTPRFESYAVFDKNFEQAVCGEEFEVTLNYLSGYGDAGYIFSPCEGAKIYIDGEETDIITDGNGKAYITLSENGKHIITAKKTEIVEEEILPLITAASFIAEVKADETGIIHNIAKVYKNSDFESHGDNLQWIVADMAVYEELFGDSENILSADETEKIKSLLVNAAVSAETPGNMAKTIIALRSLGIDAGKIYTADYKRVNLPEKLCKLIDDKDSAITNIYTLPYVLIALLNAQEYATEEQIEYLVSSAVSDKELWQSTDFGTDGITPMVLALLPYCDEREDVRETVSESIDIIKSEQREDGMIDGFEGYESASTGLAICALSAAGIDCTEVTNGGKNLIEGMMSSVNAEQNGFSNAFATEQGFRGLLAWKLLSGNYGKTMYDFSGKPMEELNLSGISACPVKFNISPASAVIKIEGESEFAENVYDLSEGEYSYKVSASGRITEEGTFSVSGDDAENHTLKEITVSLKRTNQGSGGGASISRNEKEETEQVKEETPEIKEESTFTSETFADVSADDWYYNSVKYVYENGLFAGTDKGFEPETSMTRAMLVTVLYRMASPKDTNEKVMFSDVIQNEWYAKSVNWAAENNIVNGIADGIFNPDGNITREQIAVILYRFASYCGMDVSVSGEMKNFADFEKVSDYAENAVMYAAEKGIISGRGENNIAPTETATRAEVATMLMRFAEAVK